MRIAKDLAGFTLGEADNLRKAMGKKQPEYIEKNRQLFLDGCKDNNIDKKLAEESSDESVKLLDVALENGSLNKDSIDKERKKVRFFKDNFPGGEY